MTRDEPTATLEPMVHPQDNALEESPDHPTMSNLLEPSDTFVHRHIGPDPEEIQAMLATIDCTSLDDLVSKVVPASIGIKEPLKLGKPRGERDLLNELRQIASKNRVFRSFIGMGYADCITPAVIQRNILENPGWYTQYTPYQA